MPSSAEELVLVLLVLEFCARPVRSDTTCSWSYSDSDVPPLLLTSSLAGGFDVDKDPFCAFTKAIHELCVGGTVRESIATPALYPSPDPPSPLLITSLSVL